MLTTRGVSNNQIVCTVALVISMLTSGESVQADEPFVKRINVTMDDMPIYCQYCTCIQLPDHTVFTECSDKGLFVVPRLSNNTSIFIFQRNRLHRVKYKYFAGLTELKYLDLSSNVISWIEIGAFRDLSKLKILHMNDNLFGSYEGVLKPGVFQGLGSVEELYLHNSIIYNTAKMQTIIPYKPFEDLISLKTLSIDGITNITFNSNFRVLSNLTTLTLSGVQGTCEIEHLFQDAFEGLPHLENLTLEKCDLKSIHLYALSSLRHLAYLDLSWNVNLEFRQFGKIAEGLTYTNLTILKINAIHNPNRAGTEILRQDIRYIRELGLAELYMDDNGIEYIDYGVFDQYSGKLPKTLKKLYMRKNRLHFGIYMEEIVFNYNNLEIFDAGEQEIVVRSDLDHSADYLNVMIKGKKRSVRIGRNSAKHQVKRNAKGPPMELALEELICSESRSRVQPLDFSNTINNITWMDLSGNFMPFVKTSSFVGLGALRGLDLSGNYLEYVHLGGFQGLSAVMFLDLQNNLLGNALTIDSDGIMLSPLTSLQTLNISRNRITTMNKDVFKNVPGLDTLDLSVNHIREFKVDISSLHSLQVLNLSNNRITSLRGDIRKSLDAIAEHQNVSVDLSQNKLTCNCETLHFLQWLQKTKVIFVDMNEYFCSSNDGTIMYLNTTDTIVQALEEECRSYTLIIVLCTVAGTFIVNSIIMFVVYKKRWSIRYLYYMTKIKLDIHPDGHDGDPRYPFDVFLSYGDGDRAFVIQDMLEHLEQSKGIRLNIRDRDFEIGEAIAVNISKAIRTSKKTFLLLSRHFLRNKWCNFEMNMARMEEFHQNRKTLVVVFLEQVPTTALPLQILDLLRECPKIDLPREKQHMATFWEECTSFILH